MIDEQVPKVFAGILYFGEVEFSDCVISTFKQFKGCQLDLKIFPFMPMLEAHDACYKAFLNSDSDILVKIDGDMEFKEPMTELIKQFAASIDETHWAMDILDGYTNSMIPALHLFKKDNAFVGHTDLNPDMFNKDVDRWVKGPLITHASSVNPFQAFRTGFYRGRKLNGKSAKFIANYLEKAKTSNNWLIAGANAALQEPMQKVRYDQYEIYTTFVDAMKKEFGEQLE